MIRLTIRIPGRDPVISTHTLTEIRQLDRAIYNIFRGGRVQRVEICGKGGTLTTYEDAEG